MSEVQFAQARALQIAPVPFTNKTAANRIIFVPSTDELLNKDYYIRLATAVANLKRSRRKIPDWMADNLFRLDVEFRYPCGKIFYVGDEDIEDAFGFDLSFRWLSDLIRHSRIHPKQRPHRSLESRLRLLALSFWVSNPNIARHF